MPSRLLPLVVHAGRSRLQDVLSAGASSLPPGAFGLVPPPHDDRWQASVPMTTTPNAILNIGNTRLAVSLHPPAWGVSPKIVKTADTKAMIVSHRISVLAPPPVT